MKAIVVCLFGICVFQKFNAQVSSVSKKEAVCIIGKDLLIQKDVEAEMKKIVEESQSIKLKSIFKLTM